jgi:hypothetical protein
MKSTLFSDVKRFIKYVQKRSYIIQTITLILLMAFIVRQEYVNHEINTNIVKVNKKVDFRYFNLTRSLESIHRVEINTRDGRLR